MSKTINWGDIEEIYKWECPYKKCQFLNQNHYIGDEVCCDGCGRKIKVTN